MAGHLQVTLRQRTFFFQWCNKTVIDFVCTRCESIVIDGVTCQHCELERTKKRESLQRFLEKKARESEKS